MRQLSLYIVIILIVIITGCGSDKAAITTKNGVSQYKNSSIEITKVIDTININVDSGNLQIYLDDKNEIDFRVKHTIRDYKTNEELEKLLKKYSITSKKQKNSLFFTVHYRDKIKGTQTVCSDIKLTISRRIKKINISQQLGSLAIEDKYEGDIVAKLDSVNSEIKSMEGKLSFECVTGNLRLNSGKLLDGSLVDINSGSIYVKAECMDKSKYSFKTQKGNIRLNFPVSSDILLESFGTVQNNQFTGLVGNIEIETSTKMGKISVNGYWNRTKKWEKLHK